jgi:hypothetical protein
LNILSGYHCAARITSARWLPHLVPPSGGETSRNCPRYKANHEEYESLFAQAWQVLPLLYDYEDEATDFIENTGSQETDFNGAPGAILAGLDGVREDAAG